MVQLSDILSCPDNTDALANQIISGQEYDVLQKAIQNLSIDDQKLVFTQKFLKSLISMYSKIDIKNMQTIGEFIVKTLKDKMFFEYEVYQTRVELSKVYEGMNQPYLAGQILAQVNYDSPKLQLSVKEKVDKYLSIITFFFEMEEQTAAETWISKAGNINYDLIDDKYYKFRYENLFAVNLDFQRKFLPAAQKYYYLSNYPDIDFEEANLLLNAASQCAILGNAGPLRTRILATLYKDERIQSIPNFEMLELTYMQRIVSKEQKDKFAGSLKKHQLQILRENFTVLDEAILQHNITAVSQVYESITMKSLSRLVYIGRDIVEVCIQTMIEEKRINAKIDQLIDTVSFQRDEDIPVDFNDRISQFCGRLNEFYEKITAK
ncbi:PCI-domain protein (macronuclear) [Tetrahymena thermophila SB210]|uniref:COP9 signalosome complex subunit 4 n=1 Tax=Tetrahymena thermophila (strain SB210) TaxID=312017 RepID=Q230Z7_TETTS|nr:PCI-domain protein [Tetrahymena thermophila SB210]EAR91142.2 PCI-domain protein [Tetrahymena thermophila SB210]|eukprot:XP_001011387.2 PCI-domain protein [Tetrahymena thermophila SB210]